MVRLKSLTLTNFRSFVGEHRVDWPENGLVLLRGESGVGKSTIFHAINYALGVNTIPVKDLQNWSDHGPMSVRLEVQVNDDLVDLFRSSKASYVRVNGQTVSTSNKAYEDTLAKVLGVGSAFRELLTYRDQLNPVKFTRLGDAEKKALLSDLLGLTVLEEALDAAQKDARALEVEVERSQAVYQGMVGLMGPRPQRTDGLEDRIEALKAEREEVRLLEIEEENSWRAIDTAVWVESNLQVKDLERQIQEVAVHKAEVDDTKLRALLSQEAQLMKDWDRKAKALKDKVDLRRDCIREEAEEVQELAKYQARLAAIEPDKCPTCSQSWGTKDLSESIQRDIVEIERSLRVWRRNIEETKDAESILELHSKNKPWLDLAQEIQEARKDVASVEAENQLASQSAQTKISELKAKIKNLEADRKLRLSTKRISTCETRKAQIQADLSRLQTKAKEESTQIEKWSDQFQKCESQRATAEDLTKRSRIEQDWVNFLKGFLGRIFEEVLVEIAAKANDMLRELPNTASVTVEFQIQKASGKEAITPIYSFGGQVSTLKSGASGGMATAIELAIDLAMAQTVAARKGLSLKWLLLDEAFNGFSQTVRESFLTLLNSYAKDSLVIVVDHASEFQALFQQVMTVDEKGLTWLE